MSINQRIEELEIFYKNKGITFSKFINVNAGTINNITGKRQSNPSHKILESILKADSKINIHWLILGEGEMFTEDNKIIESDLQKEVDRLKDKMGKIESTTELLKDKFREIDLEAMLKVAERMLEKERAKEG